METMAKNAGAVIGKSIEESMAKSIKIVWSWAMAKSVQLGFTSSSRLIAVTEEWRPLMHCSRSRSRFSDQEEGDGSVAEKE